LANAGEKRGAVWPPMDAWRDDFESERTGHNLSLMHLQRVERIVVGIALINSMRSSCAGIDVRPRGSITARIKREPAPAERGCCKMP
jgi:hypothetical protein